jgi:hypothetical protein
LIPLNLISDQPLKRIETPKNDQPVTLPSYERNDCPKGLIGTKAYESGAGNNMKKRALLASSCIAALLLWPDIVNASDTTTYVYDVLGRLIGTSVSGGPNNGIGTAFCLDAAGNRTTYSSGPGTMACGNGGTPNPTPTPTPTPTPVLPANAIWATTLVSGTYAQYDYDNNFELDFTGYSGGELGSISASSFDGYQVYTIDKDQYGDVYFSLIGPSGPPPNDGWTSISIPGIGTFNRISGAYLASGHISTWEWQIASGTTSPITSGTVVVY